MGEILSRKTAVFLGVFVSAAALLSACSSSTGAVSEPQPARDIQESRAFPSSVVQNFMNACVGAGTTQRGCECALDEVEKRFTLKEYTKLELSITSGQPDDVGMAKLADAKIACL